MCTRRVRKRIPRKEEEVGIEVCEEISKGGEGVGLCCGVLEGD
jgi:hypothetical protein